MTPGAHELRVRTEQDAAEATRLARELALECGLGTTDAVALATAVSEIATNQVRHAGGGLIRIRAAERPGVEVEARDEGPGIADTALALRDGWSGSAGGGLGLGLPAARRLTDEFSLESAPGRGTTVRMSKWRSVDVGVDTRRLAAWAVAAPPAERRGSTPVVLRLPSGLLLAVVRTSAAGLLREDPQALPALLVERCGGRDVAIARLDAMDGRLVWQAQPPCAGSLHRERGTAAARVAAAPRHRSASVPVLRGDTLLLATFTPPDPPPGASVREVADATRAAGPPGAVVLAARFARGSLERRGTV